MNIESVKSVLRPSWHRVIYVRDFVRLGVEKAMRNSFLTLGGGRYHEWYARRMDRLVNRHSFAELDADPTFSHYMSTGDEDLATLKMFGMQPEHALLEFGTGWGRSAQHLIPYLARGRFVGCDSSEARLDYARYHFAKRGIGADSYSLIVNGDNTFDWLGGRRFDFIWARAVFNHLPERDIEDIFEHLSKALTPTSVFLFTYKMQQKKDLHKYSAKNFYHSFQFFERLAKRTGFSVEDVTDRMASQKLNVEHLRLVAARPLPRT